MTTLFEKLRALAETEKQATAGPWEANQSSDKRRDGYVRATSIMPFAGAKASLAVAKVCTVPPLSEVRANFALSYPA